MAEKREHKSASTFQRKLKKPVREGNCDGWGASAPRLIEGAGESIEQRDDLKKKPRKNHASHRGRKPEIVMKKGQMEVFPYRKGKKRRKAYVPILQRGKGV